MLNIAICDDEQISIDIIYSKVSQYCESKNISYSVHTYTTSMDLVSSDLNNINIIFLDVDMKGMNGIDAAKEIRKVNKEVIIIYVSGYIQYAPEGYQVKAFAYILKNNIDALFDSIMDEAINELQFNEDVYTVKINNEEFDISIKDIVFIESFDKELVINCVNEKYTIKGQLNDIYAELKNKGFLQLHRSYIVNMMHILRIKNYIITLSNGREIKASQRRWREIVTEYLDWKVRT